MRPAGESGCCAALCRSSCSARARPRGRPAVFESPEAAAEAVVAALEARDRDGADRDLRAGERGRDPHRRRRRGPRGLGRVPARLPGAAPDHPRGRRRGDARDRARPLAVPGAAGPRRRPAGTSTPTAAREEVLLRRIGQNELDVIDLLRGYVAAQAAYRAMDPDGDGLPSFAASVLSRARARATGSTGPTRRARRRARSATSWRAPRPTATASTAARTSSPSPTSATTTGC